MSSDGSESTIKVPSISSPVNSGDDNDASSSTSSDSNLWFEDGNIILQTTDAAQFRVHRGVLAAGSVVFRDMFDAFGGESPAQHDKMQDGCPVISMQDEGYDLGTLLETIYHSFEIHPADPDYADIPTILRMARKYQFDRLEDSTIKILRFEFSTTLKEFETLHEKNLDPKHLYSEVQKIRLIRKINCAVENEIKAVLPGAYLLTCMHLSLQEIMEGVSIEEPWEDSAYLCPEARLSIVMGLEGLKVSLMKAVYPWGLCGTSKIIPSPNCSDNKECMATRRRDTEKAFMRLGQSLGCGTSIRLVFRILPLDDLYNKESKPQDPRQSYCAACLLALRRHIDKCRADVFAELPGHFALGTWESLLSEDDSD